MPRRSTRRPRRSSGGKNFRSASSYGGKSLFAMAKAFAQPGAEVATLYLKKALGLNTEMKFLDTAEAAGTATTSTATFMASGITIPQGITNVTRTGNNCRMTSYSLRGVLTADPAATASCKVRIIGFVQPRLMEAGLQFAPIDIVQDATTNIMTPYNLDTNGYKIIFDRTYTVNEPGMPGSSVEFKYNYKPLSHQIEWTNADTTGAGNNLLRGNIRFFIFSDALTTLFPTYAAYHRIRFVDN